MSKSTVKLDLPNHFSSFSPLFSFSFTRELKFFRISVFTFLFYFLSIFPHNQTKESRMLFCFIFSHKKSGIRSQPMPGQCGNMYFDVVEVTSNEYGTLYTFRQASHMLPTLSFLWETWPEKGLQTELSFLVGASDEKATSRYS